ncbi:AP-4 complex subunit beta-1-like [Penaeus monodon]|uniref:AP-4 complex subunit beta-1-like n=1 Tax=Penaeus monodon TaxID=6687 RepID=UPI0018A71ADB|nr:AP-4 complex subunit beta-1-like [Penaeus monodon]
MASILPEKRRMLMKMVSKEPLATSDVVELMASHDTLVKKITCYHVADQCSKNADLALLTANLLLKDTSDANPTVRSASISALAALPGIEESSVRAITTALSDQAAMVRRAGAVACMRLHSHAPQVVLECGLVNALYEGIRDSDPIVITNCILALDSILNSEGGIVVNKNIAHYLLGRVMQFSDCNAVYVLTLLLRYTPKSEEEIFAMLNTLDELLTSKTPAVLIASVKLFLHLTKDHQHLKKDMLELIHAPICKILSRNIPETSFLMVEFLQTLGDIREVFGPHYKYFLVRSKDPGYLKTQKLKVLPLVSTDSNVCQLIEEVKPFCSDYQSFREAVSCLGNLALMNSAAYKMCLCTLESLLDVPTERVVVAALECLLTIISPDLVMNNVTQAMESKVEVLEGAVAKSEPQGEDIHQLTDKSKQKPKVGPLRELPDLPKELIAAVTRAISRNTVQEAALTLVLHALGTLAAYIDTSHDIVESISPLSLAAASTHADLVTCAARVFLARPAQMQLILSAILTRALKTPGPPASRAALVYGALMEGPENAAYLLRAFTKCSCPTSEEQAV